MAESGQLYYFATLAIIAWMLCGSVSAGPFNVHHAIEESKLCNNETHFYCISSNPKCCKKANQMCIWNKPRCVDIPMLPPGDTITQQLQTSCADRKKATVEKKFPALTYLLTNDTLATALCGLASTSSEPYIAITSSSTTPEPAPKQIECDPKCICDTSNAVLPWFIGIAVILVLLLLLLLIASIIINVVLYIRIRRRETQDSNNNDKKTVSRRDNPESRKDEATGKTYAKIPGVDPHPPQSKNYSTTKRESDKVEDETWVHAKPEEPQVTLEDKKAHLEMVRVHIESQPSGNGMWTKDESDDGKNILDNKGRGNQSQAMGEGGEGESRNREENEKSNQAIGGENEGEHGKSNEEEEDKSSQSDGGEDGSKFSTVSEEEEVPSNQLGDNLGHPAGQQDPHGQQDNRAVSGLDENNQRKKPFKSANSSLLQ